jgi:CheY-like chemotaxis protein
LSLRGICVVVVDDDIDVLDALAETLVCAGAHVHTCRSANEAILAVQSRHPAILLSDIAMPGEDGCSLIKKIRGLACAQCSTTPAIALTAYSSPQHAMTILDAGFQVHLAKPVHPEDLFLAILNTVSPTTL